MSRLLLAAAALLIVTLASVNADATCNHGNLICSCIDGYTGPHCNKAPDYCHAKIVGNTTFDDICSRHGSCTDCGCCGAVCHCGVGWSGPLCEIPNKKLVQDFTRCYLFTPKTLPPTWNTSIPVGCKTNYRCLTDDLNCPYDNPRCSVPIGWCAEEGHAADDVQVTRNDTLKAFKVQGVLGDVFTALTGKDTTELLDNSLCNFHGYSKCACYPGWTGKLCDTPIPSGCNMLEAGKELQLVVDTKLGEVCGPHGTCLNIDPASPGDVTTVTCICKDGWIGKLCDNPPPVVSISERCFLFNNTLTAKNPGIPVGCHGQPVRNRCLTDNLNCPFNSPKCTNPIGWCLPERTKTPASQLFQSS